MLPSSSGCESFDASTIQCSVQPSWNAAMVWFSYSRRAPTWSLRPNGRQAPPWRHGCENSAIRRRTIWKPVPQTPSSGHSKKSCLEGCRSGSASGTPNSSSSSHVAMRPTQECADHGTRSARDVSRRALADLGPLPNAFDATLRSVLDRTEDVVLEQTTIVHGDFHQRNIHVDADRVVGVFDWDIAGPGDWRFDLVNLAFACQMYPTTCEPNAVAAAVAAVHEHCDAPTAAFLTACQTLRALSMLHNHRPDWLHQASTRIQATLTDWWI